MARHTKPPRYYSSDRSCSVNSALRQFRTVNMVVTGESEMSSLMFLVLFEVYLTRIPLTRKVTFIMMTILVDTLKQKHAGWVAINHFEWMTRFQKHRYRSMLFQEVFLRCFQVQNPDFEHKPISNIYSAHENKAWMVSVQTWAGLQC